MSWDCPHLSSDNVTCMRLEVHCDPVQKGCVLYGKVKKPSDGHSKLMAADPLCDTGALGEEAQSR